MGSLLPPKEKRCLVLIDPPYEAPDEFSVLADGLVRGHRRVRHGVFAAWYPIKQLAAVRGFLDSIRMHAIADVITVEMCLRTPLDPSRLNGCGLLVTNPPYRFESLAGPIANAVLQGLGPNDAGARAEVIRIADE
jgi:23S rRNA (adenine2030-N6)-methyltransferase